MDENQTPVATDTDTAPEMASGIVIPSIDSAIPVMDTQPSTPLQPLDVGVTIAPDQSTRAEAALSAFQAISLMNPIQGTDPVTVPAVLSGLFGSLIGENRPIQLVSQQDAVDDIVSNPPFSADPAASTVVADIKELAKAQALPELTPDADFHFPQIAEGAIERFMDESAELGRRVMAIVHDTQGALHKLHLVGFGGE